MKKWICLLLVCMMLMGSCAFAETVTGQNAMIDMPSGAVLTPDAEGYLSFRYELFTPGLMFSFAIVHAETGEIILQDQPELIEEAAYRGLGLPAEFMVPGEPYIFRLTYGEEVLEAAFTFEGEVGAGEPSAPAAPIPFAVLLTSGDATAANEHVLMLSPAQRSVLIGDMGGEMSFSWNVLKDATAMDFAFLDPASGQILVEYAYEDGVYAGPLSISLADATMIFALNQEYVFRLTCEGESLEVPFMLIESGSSDAEIAQAAMWVSGGDPSEIPDDYQLEDVPDLWGKVNDVVSNMLISSSSGLQQYAVSVQNTDGSEGTISIATPEKCVTVLRPYFSIHQAPPPAFTEETSAATFANCLNVLNYVLEEGGLLNTELYVACVGNPEEAQASFHHLNYSGALTTPQGQSWDFSFLGLMVDHQFVNNEMYFFNRYITYDKETASYPMTATLITDQAAVRDLAVFFHEAGILTDPMLIGWLEGSVEAPASAEAEKPAMQVRIQESGNVNVRAKPNADSARVGSAKAGEVYPCLSIADNGWYEIELPNGKTGFISPRKSSLVE